MAFLIKSLISRALHPGPIIMILLIVGLALRTSSKRRRLSTAVIAIDIALFLFIGFGGFNGLLRKLELSTPPFPGDDIEYCSSLDGAVVSVLGQGLETEPIPARFCDNACFRMRLTEGAYVAHSIPNSRLLISMSGEAEYSHKAEAIRQFAKTYGIDTNRVDFYCDARDTREEAAATIASAVTNKVIVVTSASHMPRSLLIFSKAGCTAIPAPCEYRYFGPNSKWKWYDWHFGWRNFERADRIFHEGFGLLFESIKPTCTKVPSQLPTDK